MNKNIMSNKKGQVNGVGIGILVVLGIFVAGFFAFMLGLFPQAGLGLDLPTGDDPRTCADSTATITFPAVNALVKSTTVTVDPRVTKADGTVVNGSATTSYGVGEKLTVLYRAPNFINDVSEEMTVACGQTSMPSKDLFATSTNTFRVFNTLSVAVTDSATGGLVNQTGSANPISMQIQIEGTVKESSGDLLIIVETNSTEVDEIRLSGLTSVTPGIVPQSHTQEFSGNSVLQAFNVEAIVDDGSNLLVSGTLTLTPENGITIGSDTIACTPVHITALSKQAFEDTDGTYQFGVEDDDSTTQFEDTWDFDVCISSA